MRNPWVGLRPFDVAESGLFYGRVKEAQIIFNLIATLPTLIIYAPSGTGKSSLINAGLAPMIESDPSHLLIFVNGRDTDIATEVRKALAASGWNPPSGLDVVALLEQHWLDRDRRAVVILDQFEERLNAVIPVDDLFESMAKLTHSRADAACMVLCLREDYLGNLEPLMRRIPGVLNGSYRVPPLSREALTEAIHGPLRQVTRTVSVQDSLVKSVLDDLGERVSVQQEPGAQRFEPGYFQIVWLTLWQTMTSRQASTLTLRMYRDLGGASKILAEFISKILDGLDPIQTEMFWAISRYLVLPTGAKVALTVEDLSSLLQSSDYLKVDDRQALLPELPAKQKMELIDTVLRRLIASDAPVLQRAIRSGREEFELLHDLLGKILLDWRIAYEKRIIAETAEFNGEVYALATRKEKPIQKRIRDESDLTRERAQAVSEARSVAEHYLSHLSVMNAVDADYLTTLAILGRRLIMWSLVLKSLSSESSSRWVGIWRDAGTKTIQRALTDSSESVRRELQRILPFMTQERSYRLRIRVPEDRFKIAAVGASSGILAGSAMLGAYLIFNHPMNALGIQYAPLTLVIAGLALWLMYGVAVLDKFDDKIKARAHLKIIFSPSPNRNRDPRKNRRNRLIAQALGWPLPAIYAHGLAIGVGWGFWAAGWASTAGYNLGILFMALIMPVALIWAFDL